LQRLTLLAAVQPALADGVVVGEEEGPPGAGVDAAADVAAEARLHPEYIVYN
jgi:hypothetical protein